MKIQRITRQNRRHFIAIMECEHCGALDINRYGYDDDNYHRNVIPNMECKRCGKTAGEDYRPLGTKYAEGVQV